MIRVNSKKMGIMKELVLSVVLLIASIFFSCEESERTPEPTEGVNVRIQFSEGKSYFDFGDLSNSELEYSVFTENKNLASIEIGLTFIPDGRTVATRVIFDSFTLDDFSDGSLTRSVDAEEMALLVGYASAEEFVGGEMFNFDVVATMDDGRIYPEETLGSLDLKDETSNISPNIREGAASSFTQNFSTFIGCITEMVEGTYIGNATNPGMPCSNDPFGYSGTLTVDKEIKVTRIGPVSWNFSDVMRFYFQGFAFNTDNEPIQVFDICNSLISFDSKGSLFNIVATGTHDPITHQIDLQWTDLGNQLITCENTYVPKQ